MRWSGSAWRAVLVVAMIGFLFAGFSVNTALTPDEAVMPIRAIPTLGLAAGVLVVWPQRRLEVLTAVFTVPIVASAIAGSGDPVTIAGVATAATAQTLIFDSLLGAFLGRPPALRSASDAMVLLATCLVAVTFGAVVFSAIQLLGSDPPEIPIDVRFARWVQHFFVEFALGVPAVVALRTPSRRLAGRAGRIEAALAASTLLATLGWAILETFTATYFLVPIIVWMAIRCGSALAAPALLSAISGLGIIAAESPDSFQAATSPTRFAALTMAFAAGGVAMIYLAQETAEARFSLLTTLSALPDTVALSTTDGRILEVWGPRDDSLPRRVLKELIDDAEGLGRAGTTHRNEAERVLEHTWQTGGNQQRLHVIRDVTAEAALEEERRRRRDEVQLATLAEQRRIAVRLHGGPVQELSAILLRHGRLFDAEDPEKELAEVEHQLVCVIADLRDAANELIPPDVGAGSVAEALRELAPRVFEPEVICEVDDQRWSHRSTVESEMLFLVGSEALVNAAVHARPSRVRVALVGLPGRAVLSVSDDGPGMLPASAGRPHLGLRLMRDRLAALGGTLELTTSESGGVLLVASMPRVDRGAVGESDAIVAGAALADPIGPADWRRI